MDIQQNEYLTHVADYHKRAAAIEAHHAQHAPLYTRALAGISGIVSVTLYEKDAGCTVGAPAAAGF
jgi:hypothetical protein